jgi:hypothetical protein
MDCPFWRAVGAEAYGGWSRSHAELVSATQRQIDRHRRSFIVALRGSAGHHTVREREYMADVDRVLKAVGEVSAGRTVVDSSKTPSYARFVASGTSLDVRLLHLVRDSRGSAFSWSRPKSRLDGDGTESMRTFGPLQASVLWTMSNAPYHIPFGIPLARIRYEDFAAAPQTSLTPVMQSLGFAELAVGGRGGTVQHTVSGNPARLGENSAIQVDARWLREMKPFDRHVVTLMTAPLLVKYGYSIRSHGS